MSESDFSGSESRRADDINGESNKRNQEYMASLNIMNMVASGKLSPEVAANVIVAQNAQIRMFAQEVSDVASYDALTGALTRNAFIKRVEDFSRSERPFALLELDIDHFKEKNDSYGHLAGDEVLRDFVANILPQIRDPNNKDFIGRYGGEEFVIFLPDLSGPEEAKAIAERILEAVRNTPSVFNDQIIETTTSIGGAFFKSGADFNTAFARADELLYQAKNGGRNRSIIAEVDKE